MDEALRQYQLDILRANLSRRRFMTGAAFASASAFLAACGGSAPSSAAVASLAASTPAAPPSTAPSVASSQAASAAATPAASYALESDLFMFNWSEYFSPDNKKTFEGQYKAKITYDSYPSNEEMLAKLQAGGKGQYDIAAPTAEVVPTMVSGGLIQKLDKGRLPNLQHISPQFRGMPFDPNDEYLVPKDWGTTGVIYRGSVKEPLTSWKDFWDLSTGKYSGKSLVVDSPGDVFVAPLKLLGFDVNTEDTNELDQARQKLMELRPHLQSIDSDNYPQTLRDGEAVLALAWNGTAYLMQQEKEYKDTGYTIPSEGTISWVDTWVLLADAPHPNAAYAFLDWIQDPNIQVVESMYAGYASANDAAKPLLPPEFVSNPAVYVPDDMLSKLSLLTDQSHNQQRADIWAEFKAG
jgi:spermidine/putrescine transport system substrate-binding protein